MSASKIGELVDSMEPEEVAEELAGLIKKLFSLLGEEARLHFVMKLVEESGEDKLSSMVHLRLAECMDEGIDPMQMCQNLVEKVAQSKQLSALLILKSWSSLKTGRKSWRAR